MSEPRRHPLIRNCLFAFRCHQRWESLESTSDARVRYCHECARSVVHCRTDEELREALLADECVAVDQEQPSGSWRTIGVVVPPAPKRP